MADEEPREPPIQVLVDEAAPGSTPPAASKESEPPSSSSSTPASTAHVGREGKTSKVDDYYAARPKFDRLGNPIPRRPAGAMSSVYGKNTIKLPGDLGSRDPRRPKSPAPASLPGDLGRNDPRRPRSTERSPAPSHHGRHISDDGGVRLHEDPEPEPQDSDEDADADYDTDGDDGRRGRDRKRPEPGRTTAGKATNIEADSDDSEREDHGGGGGSGSGRGAHHAKPDPTKGESMLSFQADSKSRSSLSSGAGGAGGTGSSQTGKRRVHPSTAFDHAPTGLSSAAQSDDESASELRAAQQLTLTMSAIHSTPSAHRVIRQIIRGDFERFQQEAEDGRKRQRMYLVATDISPEAEYALEWTIGTVLRDGDTLFAVYAADEETVGGGAGGAGSISGGGGGVEIGHGAESVRDTAAIVRGLPAMHAAPPPSPGPSPLGRAAGSSEVRSGSRGVYSSAETERRRALEDITDRCVRLLRKTRLQVRVVVEVFHCKSPRHMITEVIDFLSPTLVIIGSRGRSAVKGVLLGSFSNYLVTKSSVPVMVARKKLRKHSKSAAKRNKDGLAVPYAGTGRTGRFSNMIEAPKGKGLRVKGWDEVGID